MKLFSRIVRIKDPGKPQQPDLFAERVAGIIVCALYSLSSCLNRAGMKLSLRTRKLVLLLFCLLVSGCCIYLLVQGLT